MVDSTVGIRSTHEPMVQRKSFPGFDPAMSHGLLAAITRTATTGGLGPHYQLLHRAQLESITSVTLSRVVLDVSYVRYL